MATVNITAQTTSRAGQALTFSTPDAVDGVTFSNVGRNCILLVKNDSASPINVTFAFTQTVDGMSISSRVIAVAAGTVKAIGPFTLLYENAASNSIKVTFSAVTSVGAALISPGAAI